MLGPGIIVVISSASAVKELLDRRSASTVDRPPMFLAQEVTGGLNMVLARHSEQWRTMRKAAHTMLTPQATTRYMPDFRSFHLSLIVVIARYSNSVILSVLYGKRSPRYETEDTTTFFHVQRRWEQALELGAHPPVDMLPFLRYVPERWALWKRISREIREVQRGLYMKLLCECEERIRSGTQDGIPTFMDEVIKQQDELGMTREMACYLGGTLIEGGSDTTSYSLQSLVLALTAFPEAQRKAQEEIDRVVGSDRMPNLSDFEMMPYLQALIKETHRFRPPATLIPHRAMQDERYGTYLIPEGTTIMMNIWGIYHDPDAFDDPESFQPERYLKTEFGTKRGVDVNDWRRTLLFGAGRRLCPGISLANNTMKIITMNLVWGFDFRQLPGRSPVDIWSYSTGALMGPEPYELSITPRSLERAAIMEQGFKDAIPLFAPYEQRLSPGEKEWLYNTRK
ncbi:cytochrome P450, partial [Punctularia strigosozonata HHB-11173 SS5]|uniref:cytochrome P450 n=1 Tax=Punctularia strigosozonata (strain HHB-11173) TaxID=741275 RepID=UPI00044182E7